ncbi:hypothetical protein K503DRAFT_115231 [Rhizopogon vinicolor AM-OR11-026]|uniref:Uncharacterized protein n=1 Tax=Rhizopogon vinicolor AM-OR11-026 TaxID=1314800 RepID=A0A1B7N2K3_9AGAM|nr:hypothetical protein K503DRAFT_115231 [Rhizopogon vinicolor AM-OR11-026]
MHPLFPRTHPCCISMVPAQYRPSRPLTRPLSLAIQCTIRHFSRVAPSSHLSIQHCCLYCDLSLGLILKRHCPLSGDPVFQFCHLP